MNATVGLLKERQRAWAARAGLAVTNGYVHDLSDNLFQPLNAASRREFEFGAGNELTEAMRALHSSSALVVNVFDYWRTRDLSIIARAVGADARVDSLRFEVRHPHGVGAIPPHIDVELDGGGARATAIESKFLETCSSPKPMAAKYGDTRLWDAVEMPSVGHLARRVLSGEQVFEFLNTRQLVAHILGLARCYGHEFRLLYLSYDAGTKEAKRHSTEVERFADAVCGDVDFASTTYQQAFAGITQSGREHSAYIEYLARRYGPP